MRSFGEIAFTSRVLREQQRRGGSGRARTARREGLGPPEVTFLQTRDSLFLASVGEGGWPYVQHRGGPPGFVSVLDPTHIAWVEATGNRQYVTAGNLAADDRVAIIALDLRSRTRLKLLGRARLHSDPDPGLVGGLTQLGSNEGLMVIEVVALDWNCPKFITPRFTAEEVRRETAPLHARIAELERELVRLGGAAP